MLRSKLALFTAVAAYAAGAAAQDDEMPDLAFLEYLGSWEESDEEWLVVAEEFMGSPVDGDQELPEAIGAGTDAEVEEDGETDESDDD